MAHKGRTDAIGENPTSQKGGSSRWQPPAGLKIGAITLIIFVAILVAAGLAGASQVNPGRVSLTPTATQPSEDERPERPRDSFLQEPSYSTSDDESGEAGVAVGAPSSAAPSSAGTNDSGGTNVPAGATASSPTPTVGEGASATPAASTPGPVPAFAPGAVSVVSQIESAFGVHIHLTGQDWGDDEDEQVRNLESVKDALEALPASVLAEARTGPGGTLTFLSNDHGRTVDGWQPYGDRAANYYTNQDQGGGGRHAANQVVLQPGSTEHTVAHEVLHAYQLRDTAPGAFVSALLTPEMKSFMAATGWRQLATDEVVLATGGNSWEGVNNFFDYSGPELTYTNQSGGSSELYAPNALEAFAEAAALYYTNDSSWPLPSWAGIWGWFETNLN